MATWLLTVIAIYLVGVPVTAVWGWRAFAHESRVNRLFIALTLALCWPFFALILGLMVLLPDEIEDGF